MYPNIRAEMARKKITGRKLANDIGISETTFSKKMNGEFGFTLDEAFSIKRELAPEMPLEILFEVE